MKFPSIQAKSFGQQPDLVNLGITGKINEMEYFIFTTVCEKVPIRLTLYFY